MFEPLGFKVFFVGSKITWQGNIKTQDTTGLPFKSEKC